MFGLVKPRNLPAIIRRAEAARIFSGRSAFMTFLSRALAACLKKFGLIIIIDTSKQAVVDEIQKKKKNAAEILFINNSLCFLFCAFVFFLHSCAFPKAFSDGIPKCTPAHVFSVVLFFCFLFSVVTSHFSDSRGGVGSVTPLCF